MIIRDALTSLAAKVNSTNDLQVVLGASSQFTPIDPLQVAAQVGNACLVSAGYTSGAGDEVFYIKNTDANDCIIEELVLSAVGITIFTGATVTGTAAAGALTPVPLELGVALVRSLEARGGVSVTGLTPVGEFLNVHAVAGTIYRIPLGLRLGLNDDFAISCSAAIAISVSAKIRWDV